MVGKLPSYANLSTTSSRLNQAYRRIKIISLSDNLELHKFLLCSFPKPLFHCTCRCHKCYKSSQQEFPALSRNRNWYNPFETLFYVLLNLTLVSILNLYLLCQPFYNKIVSPVHNYLVPIYPDLHTFLHHKFDTREHPKWFAWKRNEAVKATCSSKNGEIKDGERGFSKRILGHRWGESLNQFWIEKSLIKAKGRKCGRRIKTFNLSHHEAVHLNQSNMKFSMHVFLSSIHKIIYQNRKNKWDQNRLFKSRNGIWARQDHQTKTSKKNLQTPN